MARRALLLLALAFAAFASADESTTTTIKLGVLVPYPTGDTAVPVRLANEWISAVRVSLEVLGDKYRDKFSIEAIVQNSNCDFGAAVEAAKVLLGEGVLGVVGPACSEAVKGANSVFGPANIPFISYAATLDEFAGAGYENFFRTVHADTYQAAAFAKVISAFKWQKAVLFYTNEAYGQNLKEKIQAAVTTISDWKVQEVPYPPPTETSQYLAYFIDESGKSLTEWVDDKTIVLFAVTPNAAEGLWRAAMEHNDREYLKYPWWYFGSDGTTAVDLVEQSGDNLTNLTLSIQGQIGLAPYKGNYAGNSPMKEFVAFWSEQPYDEYPGLLTLPVEPRFTEARPYVTNLIDAFWTFFYMTDHLLTIHHGATITPQMFLDCLKDTKTECAVFNGVSGTVGFNPETGDRRADLDEARYDFMNLINIAWAEKSYVKPTDSSVFRVDTTKMQRPGPIPAGVEGIPAAATLSAADLPPAVGSDLPLAPDFATFNAPPGPPSGGGLSGGAIAGIVLLLLVGLAVIGVGAWWFLKRRTREQEVHTQFVRML